MLIASVSMGLWEHPVLGEIGPQIQGIGKAARVLMRLHTKYRLLPTPRSVALRLLLLGGAPAL